MKSRNQLLVLLLSVTSVEWGSSAFLLNSSRRRLVVPKATSDTSAETAEERRHCVYRSPVTHKWTPRIELSELTVGQALEGAMIVQDKLDGRTGPKVWVDCGVGRHKSSNNSWKIQTAMLRLGGPNMKVSVASKKAARLRKKQPFTVFVSRIRLDNDQLEVTLLEEEIPTAVEQQQQKRISVSSLKVGQELSGIIQRVEDYGVLVNVGATRPGLLHIRRVGDLYQKYMNKSAGLQKVGLVKGVQVDVQVISCDQKRLFLDFSDSLKQEAERKYNSKKVDDEEDTPDTDPYAEETALFAAQQQQQQQQQKTEPTSLVDDEEEEDEDEDYDEDDDDDDDYDEDRDIEDAMGLGRY